LIRLILLSILSQTQFPGNNTRGPYKLPDRFIILSSDSVWIGDSLLSKDDYAIDYNRGEVTFKNPIPDSLEVRIRYQRVPFPLKERYFHREEMPYKEKGEPIPAKPEISEREESEITARGSKSISAGIGTEQDLSLNQSLRLELEGNLAGIGIEGWLSDQSTPIPPEGVTKEIRELDRVLINIHSKNFKGSLGDVDFNLPFTDFGTVDRRIEGGIGEVNFSNIRVRAGIGKTKGKYGHKSFTGEDGNQGPYRLEESIVPGSERVYLDGKLLVRGIDNDYTIDYSTGEVYFTNRHIITSRSRIEIDFQYNTEGFERNDYGIEGEYRIGAFVMGFNSYSEIEDPLEMSSSDRDYLSRIGDDTAKAWVSGASYVGEGKGDYIKEGDHFLFVGEEKGDYRVRFSYMGEGKGEYIYDNENSAYIWVGKNKGRYSPLVYLKPPERSSAFLSKLGIDFNRFRVSLDGIVSERDRNIYSSRDEGDNRGFGYRITSTYRIKRFELSYTRRFMGKNFFLPTREREVDFKYRWGIEPPEEEETDGVHFLLKPFSSLRLTGDIGRLKNRRRWEFGGEFKNLQYRFFSLPEISRHQFSFEPLIMGAAPRFSLFKEDSDTSRFLEVGTGIEIGGFNISYTQREEKGYDSSLKRWLKRSISYIPQLETRIGLYKSISLEGLMGYQRKRFLEEEGNDLSHLFLTLQGWYNSPRGISVSLFGQSTHRLSQLKEVEYIRVEKGKGDYSKNPETGEFYPDSLGDYIRRVLPKGNPLPSNRLEIRTEVDLSPFKSFEFQGMYGRVSEISDSLSLQKSEYLTSWINVLPYGKIISFTVGQDYNLYEEEEKKKSYYLELKSSSISNLLLRGRVEYSQYIRTASEHMEDEWKIEFEPTLLLNLNPFIKLSYSRRWIEEPLYYPEFGRFILDSKCIGMGLRGSYKGGVLSLGFDLIQRSSDVKELPFDIRIDQPLGITPSLSLSFDRYLSTNLILSLQYLFEDRPDRDPQHSFNSSLRLYF